MFSWFKPQCPLDQEAKRWVETRLQWLSDQFGLDVFLRRDVITPTRNHFPVRLNGEYGSVRALLDHVCRYMEVEPGLVKLELFTAQDTIWLVNEQGKYLPSGPAGLYSQSTQHSIIQINTEQLADIPGLVGTMAHELSHLKLIGERRILGLEFDNELLTDLTAVYHGFGIFLGNSPRNWDSQYGLWPGTNLNRPEYMSLPMFAYALAHIAWLLGVRKPSWYPYLSFDLKACFRQAVSYLNQTNDSSFKPHL